MTDASPVVFGMDSTVTRPPHVLEIRDAPDNALHILVALTKGTAVAVPEGIGEPLGQIFSGAVALVPDEKQVYEIIFEGYILYQVGNESFCRWGPEEQFTGTYFLVFDRSKLLEQLSEFSDCQQFPDGTYYPHPWKHYGIGALNHTINVISPNEPIIQRRTDTHLPPLQD